ncbi:hypothetical protein [Cellulomonas sp.]|uniref:hypothetical protein n=1 Tax=Cellulomonas sp. TaxID=40001 RepID=UPI002811961F|nr:hypothetical protein [Cellulomonas sp.]
MTGGPVRPAVARARAAVVTVLVAVTALLAGVGGASAASLPIAPVTRVWATTSTGCATGTAVVTPAARTDASSVAVSGLDVSRCPGTARLEVWVVTSTGATRALAGTVGGRASVPANPPVTVAPGTAVSVRVAGWVRPATLGVLAAPGDDAVVEAARGIVITDRRWTIGDDDRQACVTVTVRATSAQPVEWRLEVMQQAAPWYGDTVADHYVLEGDGETAQMLRDTPTRGRLQIGGRLRDWGDYRYLSTATDDAYPTERTLTLCNRQLPLQPDVPSAYSATVTQTRWDAPPSTWNGQVEVCYAVVVHGNGSSPFNVGWTASVDLAAALAHVRSYPGGTSRVSVSLSDSQRTVTTSGSVVTMRNGAYGALKGTESIEMAVCVSRW